MRRLALTLLLLCSNAGGQVAVGHQDVVTVPAEPQNLGALKQQLKLYHDCAEMDCYTPQLEHQIDIASGFLNQSVAAAKPGEKLALVLDIDETALSNWLVEQHDDFGYITNDSNWFIALRLGKAIPGTLRLYREAVKNHIAVFFITGRPENQRADTAANLKAEGFSSWQELFLRSENHPKSETTAEYKSGGRAKIVARGYRIVLNVGDQLSDLAGEPQAEHSVKLPNPFYLIP
jgi:predicted secreted acid phosphatase